MSTTLKFLQLEISERKNRAEKLHAMMYGYWGGSVWDCDDKNADVFYDFIDLEYNLLSILDHCVLTRKLFNEQLLEQLTLKITS